MMKRLGTYLISLLLLLPYPVLCGEEGTKGSSSEIQEYEYLKRSQGLIAMQRYQEALSVLREYYKGDSFIRDIVIYLSALAKRGMKRFHESNAEVYRLLEEHPESPFLKKAKALEARNNLSILESGNVETPHSYESLLWDYIKSCPDDHEVAYLFADYLKRKGDKEKAKGIFLDLYRGNSRFSDIVQKELTEADITAGVLIEKASNYLKEMEYKKAEDILRYALTLKDGLVHEQEIRKRLGLSLFMQKRYSEAADVYMQAGDLYNAARSYFRKGDMEGFNNLLPRLVRMSDKRAGNLLIALASKRRREGDINEALKLFEDVGSSYPHLREEALWGKAWTLYRCGRFGDAHRILAELNRRYPSSKYSYWLKRAEKFRSPSPEDVQKIDSEPFARLSSFHSLQTLEDREYNDFYDLLEYITSPRFSIEKQDRVDRGATVNLNTGAPKTSIDLMRIDILLSLGFKQEAIKEVFKMVEGRKIGIVNAALYSLHKVAAYRSAIKLASELRNGLNADDYKELMYPLAFWQYVEPVSKRYDLDPLLLLSIIREESRFEPEARSPAGALGLMQVMPVTASRLVKKAGLGLETIELKDVKTNIVIGAFYLKELLKEFGTLPAAIAAYNAGEDRVRDWLKRGNYRGTDEFIEDIPYDETKNYVKKVLISYVNYVSLSYRSKTDRRDAHNQ